MNAAQWMSRLGDSQFISQFTVPGTHDSATYTAGSLEGARYVKTQDLSIADQMNAGCRFLDIRGRLLGNHLVMHHGPYYLNLNFDDVIGFCTAFLAANPTECILMSLKEEYEPADDTITYEQAVKNYIAENPGLWYTGDLLPTLGSVRGKIVLLRRFGLDPGSGPLGIPLDLADNTSGTAEMSASQVLIYEDLYNPINLGQKETAVAANLEAAFGNGSPDNFFLTFTSGYIKLGFTPAGMADELDPFLVNQVFMRSGNFGVVAMDFIDPQTCAALIATSFPAPDSLFAAFVADDSSNTLMVTASPDGETWLGEHTAGQFAQFSPSLAQSAGRLFAAFVANNGTNTLLVSSSGDGNNWSPNVSFGQSTQASPSIALFNGRLYLAFVANNDTNALLVCSSADGQNWSADFSVNQFSGTAPSPAAFNGRLYLAFVANNSTNTLLVCSSADGQNWSGNTSVNQFSSTAPSLAVFDDRLYLAFVADSSTNSLLVCSSADGQSWSGNISVNQFSSTAPSLAVFGDRLYLAFVANDPMHTLLVCSSADGQNWSANTSTGLGSLSAPALAVSTFA